MWESGYRLSSLLKAKLQMYKCKLNFQSCSVYSTCLTWFWESVAWTDVCCYCCVLDCETSTFSWEEGIETLTFSWENLILFPVCETLFSFSWSCGSEMCFLKWGIWNGQGSENEDAF